MLFPCWGGEKSSPLAVFRPAVLNSPESYYLHLGGAQQGPYTIRQIDHLVNSGLISAETLYWCEGLDQWQPVTTLVTLRKKRKRWVKPAIFVLSLLLLAVPVRIFGPIVVVGWEEANQHEFTQSAAYWRARDVVRSDLRRRGFIVEFDPLSSATVTLADGVATVHLTGTSIADARHSRRTAWLVSLRFDSTTQEWIGGGFTEPAPP